MNWTFLAPLLLGFALHSASALTAGTGRAVPLQHWWGQRGGQAASLGLRVLGALLWIVGLALAAQTPSRELWTPGPITDALGWAMLVAGGMPIALALRSLGPRVAAPSSADTLIEDGPYALLRHPIHSGMFLEFAGFFLLQPSLAVAVACGLGVLWLLIQTKLEELDLIARVPRYREYMARVPRFIPTRRKTRRH